MRRKIILILALFVGGLVYFLTTNKNMTTRQLLLKWVYPMLMKVSGKKETGIIYSDKKVEPLQSFYSINLEKSSGEKFLADLYKGKKILIVNTASDCGYTAQYEELQKLQDQFPEGLVVIAFPSNDFKEQEKGTDDEIANFCKINYGVQFPIMKKSVVIKGSTQNQVFEWLSKKEKNGWNEKAPSWNFSKYLINEKGDLIAYFEPFISPLDKSIVDRIKE